MIRVDLDTGQKDDSVLRRAGENMPACRGIAGEPIGIVEGAGAYSDEPRKSLDCK
jgi:hypothetical protein